MLMPHIIYKVVSNDKFSVKQNELYFFEIALLPTLDKL